MATRIEKDSMGEFAVPEEMLYGAQTARAVENFPISGRGIGREMIRALGLIKLAAAEVNLGLGLIDKARSEAIAAAAREVADGKWDAHFPVDVFQTGSGTSSNMNANEVISNRAIQLMGGKVGSKDPVHPNDHVNLGQSSNDVFPTAIHVAALSLIEKQLLPALAKLQKELAAKASEFDPIVKTGRTHLQDATPIRLGQEFSGYAAQVAHAIAHIKDSSPHLSELAIGGTAVGTGINTHRDFGRLMAARLTELTGVSFVEAENHFEAQAARDACVQMSGCLKSLAQALIKIANDLRWLGSGPRLGLGELIVPAVQPGSSIMPGKVNPVIAEALIMASVQAIANDAAITICGLSGNFELNVMMPLIAKDLLESIKLLAAAARVFASKFVAGLRADVDRIAGMNERALMLATALVPKIGYDRAAELAKEAHRTGKTVREVALAQNIAAPDELDRLLDLRGLTSPD